MDPRCFGEYWDSDPRCIGCERKQKCAEELVKLIFEGRSKRPSAIIEVK